MTNGHISWTLPVDKPLLGSLSSHLDDGGKTIAKLKKINLRLFKLKRVYSDPRKLSKVGGFSWSWILKDYSGSKRERKIRRRMFTSSIKRLIRSFSRRSRAVDVKGWYTETVMHVQSLCFAQKPNRFLTLSLSSWFLIKGAVSRNSAKLGNCKMPVKLRET